MRGISLREIADSTRISLKFLQALEDDRIENMPGGFFIRAILRSYARSIGLDEHQVLNKYEEMRLFNEQLQYQEARRAPRPAGPPGRRKILLVIIAVIAVVVAAALLYLFVLSPRKGQTPAAKPAPPTGPESLPLTPAPRSRQQVVDPAPEEIRSLAVDFSFNEETWLQVYADGNPVWDGVKRTGESLRVGAERELVINCGNAGGMALVLNGKHVRPLGAPGTVRKDVRISLENWREYLLPEEDH